MFEVISMSDDTSIETKKPKGRSPSYPAIDLETAIGRAVQLYERERQHPTALETIRRHWGYKSLNGPAALNLAALKKFGLIDYTGAGPDRRARITDLAVEIMANPDAVARERAIKEAALLPTIHRELWDEYGPNLPSDDNLAWELTRNRKFTETGAREFIPEYRQTITFAKLSSPDSVAPQTPPRDEVEDDDEQPPPPPPPDERPKHRRQGGMSQSGVLTIPVPVIGASTITIEGEFPVTEAAWDQFLAVLAAMKPGLVSNEPDSVRGDGDRAARG
jgi:hypothetical protein